MMIEPVQFIFLMHGQAFDEEVIGYLPFQGAEFCVHPSPKDCKMWRVAHVRTSFRFPIDDFADQQAALALADDLSRKCPSASLVEYVPGVTERGTGNASGPQQELVAEIKAVLAAAA